MNQERMWARGYRHYCIAVNTLPQYMGRNLKDMPNNKGYIWKDVIFYGALPDENNGHTIIFEKGRDKLIIHQYSTNDGEERYKRIDKKYNDNQLGQNNQGQNNQGQNRSGENNQGQNRQGQNRQGQNRQGQNRQGQNRQGQNRQNRSGEKKQSLLLKRKKKD